eukprot:9443584-Pyramimonas_sp.AAC.1
MSAMSISDADGTTRSPAIKATPLTVVSSISKTEAGLSCGSVSQDAPPPRKLDTPGRSARAPAKPKEAADATGARCSCPVPP